MLNGLWPVAHVHAYDDNQIVHQHVIADGSGHPGDHADDHDAGVGQPDHAVVAERLEGHDTSRGAAEGELEVGDEPRAWRGPSRERRPAGSSGLVGVDARGGGHAQEAKQVAAKHGVTHS